jgi:hypothetical protein
MTILGSRFGGPNCGAARIKEGTGSVASPPCYNHQLQTNTHTGWRAHTVLWDEIRAQIDLAEDNPQPSLAGFKARSNPGIEGTTLPRRVERGGR